MEICVNNSLLEKIEELSREYERTWGKEVDYTTFPKGINQEKMVKCLEHMIDTNDSLLVAYEKLFLKNNTSQKE